MKNDTEDWAVADTITFLGLNNNKTKEHMVRNAVKRGIEIGYEKALRKLRALPECGWSDDALEVADWLDQNRS